MEPTSAFMEFGSITIPPFLLPMLTTVTLIPLPVGDVPVFVFVPAVLVIESVGVPVAVCAKAAPARRSADVITDENNMLYFLGSLTD
jgi:hypothetical protein